MTRTSVTEEWEQHRDDLLRIYAMLSRRPTSNVEKHMRYLQDIIEDLKSDIFEYGDLDR